MSDDLVLIMLMERFSSMNQKSDYMPLLMGMMLAVFLIILYKLVIKDNDQFRSPQLTESFYPLPQPQKRIEPMTPMRPQIQYLPLQYPFHNEFY